MKFRFRTPSLRRRIAARSSVRRYIRHSLGLKAPRGWGWLTNPRRALYNRIYHRTTFGVDDILKTPRRPRTSQSVAWGGCVGFSVLLLGGLLCLLLLSALQ